MPSRQRLPAFVFILGACAAFTSGAYAAARAIGSTDRVTGGVHLGLDDPPPPVAPAVIARDRTTGRATIRATRLTAPLRVDGRLDEEVYSLVPSVSDFVQMEPKAGAPATERTDLWILFDADNVYVSFRCWESHPERMVVKEMRRDNSNLWLGENVAFMFDTFRDRRNGVEFGVAPSGGRYEGQITNERSYNGDWNPLWQAAVSQFTGGWSVEAAVPFKSLRYRPGREQIWVQARRINAWKNELSFLTPLPPELGMGGGIFAASLAPAVVGLEAPDGSLHVEVKPYATADRTLNRGLTPAQFDRVSARAGLDLKYAITKNLTADVTYHPDFAQVEADEQQLNLTRFSLFFLEKREFFLENQGTFAFGGAGNTDMPLLFYSRRIGLSHAQPVPLELGERLTGRAGVYSLGLLNIESGDQLVTGTPATNFSVVRIKRDVWRRSSIGVIATNRSHGDTDAMGNAAYGVDGTLAFFQNLTINTYWARTVTAGASDHAVSYRGQLSYAGDRYGFQLERLVVGANFDPQIGYVRRPGVQENIGSFRFSPRPRAAKRIRKLYWTTTATHISNSTGGVETSDVLSDFTIELQTSDRLTTQVEHDYEFAPRSFVIASGTAIPAAGYNLDTVRLAYTLGPQRVVSGRVLAEYGAFYGGRRAALSVTSSRVNASPRLSLEPTYSINRFDLPQGTSTATLAGSRVTFTVTPQMFVSSLLQYNSSTHVVSSNLRLRWEYLPGSELFVVYSDERDTQSAGGPVLQARTFVVKFNRLFRI